MTEFYYKEIKSLDSHFVELFWRYAMYFWIIFEHAVVVTASILILWILHVRSLQGLLWYLTGIVAFGIAQFLLVTVKKTIDEVKQISTDNIVVYFKALSPIARP
jgi:hypothetical protein